MAEEKANTKSIKRNYLYNMIYQVLILILPLVTTPYLSRVLGAEGIGIYGYTYAIVTYFILFGSLGVSLYGQREIAYAQENPEKRMSTFVELILFRLITISIAIIPYAIFFIYGNNNYQFCYRILLIEIIAAAFDISWFFQGMEEFKKTVTRNVFVRVCSVTCVFLFVKTKEDLSKKKFRCVKAIDKSKVPKNDNKHRLVVSKGSWWMLIVLAVLMLLLLFIQ